MAALLHFHQVIVVQTALVILVILGEMVAMVVNVYLHQKIVAQFLAFKINRYIST
jgi:hypothetical protein